MVVVQKLRFLNNSNITRGVGIEESEINEILQKVQAMNLYIKSDSTDPYRNLALEQTIFDRLDRRHNYFMLWQNHNSIIIGRHQNTVEEINTAFVRERNITVARRLSGGGAVYHDLGNLNFTFITDVESMTALDFSSFCIPIQKALFSFGVRAEITGRNDMTVDGKKFSGNSQYIKQNRVMHHGTILYDSDLSMVSQALRVSKDKIESKGIKSIKSRITNIRPYMQKDISIDCFWEALREYMFAEYTMQELTLPEDAEKETERLRETVYSQWSWNYGVSPSYNLKKERRIEGCGKIEILLDITQGGLIRNMTIYGDFFGTRDIGELNARLTGCPMEAGKIRRALEGVDLSLYFNNLNGAEPDAPVPPVKGALESFLSILFE
jgi:lipoate-protein ligase A